MHNSFKCCQHTEATPSKETFGNETHTFARARIADSIMTMLDPANPHAIVLMHAGFPSLQ